MTCTFKGFVGGIDEAGRGPIAGPVVASCVIWQEIPGEKNGINDSKLLTERKRVELFEWIHENAYRVGIGISTQGEIERLNILHASLLSMERALMDTGIEPDLLLIDGNYRILSHPESKPVVKGDRRCFFIACASIIAKVTRDRIMDELHDLYPQYNFKKNKGYPTSEHLKAIKRYGPSPVHRRTFKGVKEYFV
ncbi:MAG: ribonuclease HII [Syntrophorhabdaceae bacterium]|nr:ribonuclease HII [Syntrophorhabdaceae bacterium]